ncbi:MAG: cytochrome P450 [Acidimicrobiia bacterium]
MVEFDPHDPSFAKTGVPFDKLAAIRRDGAVYPIPHGGWYLAKRDEVLTSLKEVRTFRADLSQSLGNSFGGVEEIPPELLLLSEIEEPRHGQVRRLYNSYFGPHKINKLQPFVVDTCNALIDALVADGGGDLVPGWTVPIPSRVIAQVIGVAPGDSAKFVQWSSLGLLGARAALAGADVEVPPIRAYIDAELASRRAMDEPPDDVFTLFMRATIEDRPLTNEEIATQIQFMVLAGVGTTKVLLGHMFDLLMHDPALYARVRADRDLVARVVEESLRRDAPVQSTPRRCLADASLGGAQFKQGDWVIVGLGSANRDESVYDAPDEFRLDRPDPRDHLAFGGGPHVCPGASLARMEATTALNTFLDRIAELKPVPGFAYQPLPGTLETPTSLPCLVVPA